MPSYQTNALSSLNAINAYSSGTPCRAATGTYCREVPDVSADADPGTGYLIYYTGTDTGYSGGWQGVGGTSAAAPLWAALMALTNAESACSGTPIGFADPDLYTVASTASYSSAFQDITSFNNDYGERYDGTYPAGIGYDMASGLGTPNASVLSGMLCSLKGSPVPTVTTGSASLVTTSLATLGGTLNPNGTPATYQFQYGTTTAYGTKTTLTSAGNGTSSVPVTAEVSGLSPSTTYDFRLLATNIVGTAHGSNGSFTTPAVSLAPTVTTGTASSVAWSTATLGGTVNPNDYPTTYQFNYGTTMAYGFTTTATAAGSGTSGAPAVADLTGLSPSTGYDFQLVATNINGTTYGSNGTFATSAAPPTPTVTTGAASAVTVGGATLGGTVNPNGWPTTYQFDYGPTTTYGMSTASTDAGSGTSGVVVSANLSGLSPDTTYDFQLVATDAGGTAYGSNGMFTTPAAITSAVSESQYLLPNSDGVTWQVMDPTNLALTMTRQHRGGAAQRQRRPLDRHRRVQPGHRHRGDAGGGNPGAGGLEGVGRLRGDLLAQRRLRGDGVSDDRGDHLHGPDRLEDQQAGDRVDHRGGSGADRVSFSPTRLTAGRTARSGTRAWSAPPSTACPTATGAPGTRSMPPI